MIRFLAIAVTIYFTGMAHSEAGDGLKCFASENEKQKHLDDLDKRAQMALMDEDAMPPRAEFSAGPEAFDTRVQQLRSDYAGALSQRRAAAELPLCRKVQSKGARESPPPAPPDATGVGVRPDGKKAEKVAACIQKLMKKRDDLGQNENEYGSKEYQQAVDLVDRAIANPVVALENCEDAPPPAPPESGSSPVGIDCENKALGVVYTGRGRDLLLEVLNNVPFAEVSTDRKVFIEEWLPPPSDFVETEVKVVYKRGSNRKVLLAEGGKEAECKFMQTSARRMINSHTRRQDLDNLHPELRGKENIHKYFKNLSPKWMKVSCTSFAKAINDPVDSQSNTPEDPEDRCNAAEKDKETRIIIDGYGLLDLEITCSIVDKNESKTALTPDQLDKVLESFGLKIDDSDMKTCDAVEEGILVVREIKQRLNAAKAEYDNCIDQFYFFTSEEKACARHKQVLDDWRVKYFSAQTKLPVETSALPVETQPSASASE